MRVVSILWTLLQLTGTKNNVDLYGERKISDDTRHVGRAANRESRDMVSASKSMSRMIKNSPNQLPNDHHMLTSLDESTP